MATYTVNVGNIAPSTTEAQLNDFFTFCGKISSIDFKPGESKLATIHFEKPSAAKTALMLNGGTLDGSHLAVTSDAVHPDEPDEPHNDGVPFHQSDKPRAGIAAEYLAKGYTLSDQILQRAIDLDNTHGISKRFLSYMSSMDSTIGSKALGPDQTVSAKVQSTLSAAGTQARNLDETKGISKTANDYYSKAMASPFGQKVFNFYTTTSKQIFDIHEEAKRISTHKKNSAATPGGPAGAGTDAAAPPPASGGDAPTTNAPTVV